MAFNAHYEIENNIAKITLSGELDASSADVFRTEVEKAAEHTPRAVALMMEDLDYMASAGIRVLIFAKQKMGTGIHMYAVAPQPQIVETLEMTGLTYSIEVMEKFDPSVVDNQ